MDNIFQELLERRKEWVKKHTSGSQTVTLTKGEYQRLKKATKKWTEKMFVPQPLFSEDFQRRQEKIVHDLENPTKIFGMQIEVVG